MKNNESLVNVAKELGLSVIADESAVNKAILITRINELIETDFQKLVSILYRMDVSEKKLTFLLQDNPGKDAANIIAELMIERQAQKIRSREAFRKDDSEIDEEEKW